MSGHAALEFEKVTPSSFLKQSLWPKLSSTEAVV